MTVSGTGPYDTGRVREEQEGNLPVDGEGMSTMGRRPPICIVGIGESTLGLVPNSTSMSLTVQAVSCALIDAGLTIRDIDGCLSKLPIKSQRFSLLISWRHARVATSVMVMICMPVDVRQFWPLAEAARAIEAGLCHTVLVAFGRTGSAIISRRDQLMANCIGATKIGRNRLARRTTGGLCTGGKTPYASLWDHA